MHHRLDSSSTNGDHSPMIGIDSKRSEFGRRMSDEKADSTGYSRWSSSTDNIQLAIKDGKPACIKLLSWKRWLIIVIASALVALVLGFIFGYLTRRATHLKDKGSYADVTPQPTVATSSEKYTDEAYKELSALINPQSIMKYIEDYKAKGNTYHAGSTAVNNSLHELDEHCVASGLKLTQVTYSKVLLSRPINMTYEVTGANNYKSSILASTADTLKPFVAYTHSGSATGPPVYVSYGHKADFSNEVNYTGAICYTRYGQLNPFNMVVNAASQGCAGVVIYPDPEEFPDITDSQTVIANGKGISGDAQTPGFPTVTENTYKLRFEDITGTYIPPDIPVVSASQEMVRKALSSLVTDDATNIEKTGSFLTGYLSRYPSTDTSVSINVNNEFPVETVTRSICAYRGSQDVDKFIFVSTHHDEAGSGNVDPATGQAVMREMIRLLADNLDVYQSKRSIVFLSTDTSYLDIAHHEFIEENLREYGERLVAFVALTGTLAQGSYLQVKSSPPLQDFIKNITSGFPDANPRYTGVEGSHFYRTYYSNLAAPVLEMSFSDKQEVGGVEALPICCDSTSGLTDEERVKLTAQIHLQTLMKLAGAPIIPYKSTEISELYEQGLEMVKEHKGLVDDKLLKDLEKAVSQLGYMLRMLDEMIQATAKVRTDDIVLRRLNDALIGLTRSCLQPLGVPMIDPKDSTKVIRNLNNKNMLLGSISTNDNEMKPFPGLYELFTLSKNASSPEISNEIAKHITEIMASITDTADYSKRAIGDPFLQKQ